jgi:AraC-like DNA-binding protein/mannose-6-phosphate isomerase-like protein (cupin superfamily)
MAAAPPGEKSDWTLGRDIIMIKGIRLQPKGERSMNRTGNVDPGSLYHPDLMTGQYRPYIEAYYYKQWNGFQMPFHQHKAVEIMVVISGVCTVETERETLKLKKGDLILLDSEVAHRLLVEEQSPCRMLNVEFIFTPQAGSFPAIKDAAAGESALAEMLQTTRPYVVVRDSGDAYQTLKSLVLELDEKREDGSWMVQLLMNQLLIRIARLIKDTAENEKPYDAYTRKTVKYLHQNYDRDIQVKHIAAEVSLHPGYLQRIFKEKMGLTVMEYLTSLRMDKAKMLLTRTDLPVIDIPEYIGINSREYFSMIFKKHVGQSPLAYRKAQETYVR